jgi:hypothetical protein
MGGIIKFIGEVVNLEGAIVKKLGEIDRQKRKNHQQKGISFRWKRKFDPRRGNVSRKLEVDWGRKSTPALIQRHERGADGLR